MASNAIGYRDLDVWQQSMKLVELIFQLTEKLPEHQRFGLVSQLQRAAISVPSNIAEGHAKRSGKDYKRHVTIAAGSVAELETQIELCVRLRLCGRDQVRDCWSLSQRVAQMLSKLSRSLAIKPERRKPNAERRAG